MVFSVGVQTSVLAVHEKFYMVVSIIVRLSFTLRNNAIYI